MLNILSTLSGIVRPGYILLCFGFVIVQLFTGRLLAQEGGPLGGPEYWGLKTHGSIDYNMDELIGIRDNGGGKIHWTPPRGSEIVECSFKKFNDDIIYVCLDNGDIYELEYISFLGWSQPRLRSHAKLNFNQLVGDALYGIANYQVYVSRDSAATWDIDSAGTAGGYANGVTVDTLQWVYLANSNGLFKQEPDSNVWRKITSFPGTYPTAVFADRYNRLFATGSGRVYMSTDAGASWNVDTTGFYGSRNINGFCDDAFGNIYARERTGIWKSTGGTAPWVRIDQQLKALAADPSIYSLITDIDGDSLLVASTVFGAYLSSDQGETWSPSTRPLSAKVMYGFAKTSSGRRVTSTSLGVYTSDDSIWTKTFPTTGFLSACPVQSDANGDLYTLGAPINPSVNFSIRGNWKSTDEGSTWIPDTAGLADIGPGIQQLVYFVDAIGVQHFAFYNGGANYFIKQAGENWKPDTMGFGLRTNILPTAFGSDRHGNLYVTSINLNGGQGMVWIQATNNAVWTPDTLGLGGAQVYSITGDKEGNVLAGTLTGVFKKTGSTWAKLPPPPGLEGFAAFVVSVDSTGKTIAGFSSLIGLTYIWRGLYATSDGGATWAFLGLDSISVRGLVSYGDTTYAYTYAAGIYKVRTGAVTTAVGNSALPGSFTLNQNYPNPFNPATVIRYELPAAGMVILSVYNVLGQKISTLVNERQEAGQKSVRFAMPDIPSGVYFYELSVDGRSRARRMILMK